jgi:hypothetical protein
LHAKAPLIGSYLSKLHQKQRFFKNICIHLYSAHSNKMTIFRYIFQIFPSLLLFVKSPYTPIYLHPLIYDHLNYLPTFDFNVPNNINKYEHPRSLINAINIKVIIKNLTLQTLNHKTSEIPKSNPILTHPTIHPSRITIHPTTNSKNPFPRINPLFTPSKRSQRSSQSLYHDNPNDPL